MLMDVEIQSLKSETMKKKPNNWYNNIKFTSFKCIFIKIHTFEIILFILFVYVKIHFFCKIVGFANSFMQMQGLLNTTNKINATQ